MLLISIGIAAGLSLPRRTDWALRQKKAGFRHFPFLNTIKDQRHLDLSKLHTQPRILSPTPRHEKCQPSCTVMLSRTSSEFFCKASYLMCSQSTPSKNGLLFISSTPDAPILCSHSQQNLGWKEEWKWRQNESIPSRNGTAFQTDSTTVSPRIKWRELKTPISKTTHEVTLSNITSNAAVQMWYSSITEVESKKTYRAWKLNMDIFVLKMDKWLKISGVHIQMKESAGIGMLHAPAHPCHEPCYVP